jgi:tetratricopeptide (TPR) repeat protein
VVALGLGSGWILARAAERSSAWRWVAIPAAIAALTSSIGMLLPANDLERGLSRARAIAEGPPSRAPDEAATTWEFLGMRYLGQSEYPRAAAALAEAARLSPGPTIVREWALAEAQSGRLDRARDIYRQLLERDSTNVMAWYSLAAISSQLGDYRASARALERALALDSTLEAARENLDLIRRAHPELFDPSPR